MGNLAGGWPQTISQFVEQASGRAVWLTKYAADEGVSDILVGSTGCVPDRVEGRIWVVAGALDVQSTSLDTLLLQLHKARAAGMLLPVTRIPESTGQLAKALAFNVLGAEMGDIDGILKDWWKALSGRALLVREDGDAVCHELRRAWLACQSTEEFLAHAAVVVQGRVTWSSGMDMESAFGDPQAATAVHYVATIEWGRGAGGAVKVELPSPAEAMKFVMPYLSDLIGVLVDRESMVIESELRLRGELLLELLVDRGAPTGSVLRAAERFDMDLGRENIVALWDLDDFTLTVQSGHLTELRILRLKREVLTVLERETRQTFGDAWVLPSSDEFVVIFPGRAADWPATRVVDALCRIQREVLSILSSYRVKGITAGIGSSYSGAPGLRHSFAEAHEALLVGRAHHGSRSVTHFKDLGLQRFLFGWFDSPRSRDLAYEFIKPLLEDDRHQRSELLTTLRAYLEASSRLAPAATALGIHRNTLRYRLDRISQLLKLDLRDPDVQLVLQLVVRVLPEELGETSKNS